MVSARVYSVSRINEYVKTVITSDYHLKNISIQGEVSNCKYHTSGHIYFTIKDEKAALNGIMFRGDRGGLKCQIKNGDKVVVTGSVSLYEGNGTCQIYAKRIEPGGEGDLARQFEELKKRLEESGMFDPMYKKPLPQYISSLGVVTAPTGAAVQDIIRISKRRYPGIRIVVYPALVQGKNAAASIVKGIETLDSMGLDVLIVGRGGGSMEDLWAFNEEIVARAVFDCNTPVISAVGHQTDSVITDFVADKYASTPSAAAELAVFDYTEAKALLDAKALSLKQHIDSRILRVQNDLLGKKLKLANLSPEGRLRSNQQRAVELEDKLRGLMEGKLDKTNQRLDYLSKRFDVAHPDRVIKRDADRIASLAGRLHALSPAARLSGGFSYVSDENGRKVVDATVLSPGDVLRIRMSRGKISAEVLEVSEE